MTIPQAGPNIAPKPTKPGITANWALFATSLALLVVGVLAFFNPFFGYFQLAIEWVSDSSNPFPFSAIYDIFLAISLPALLIAGGVIGLTLRRPKWVLSISLLTLALWYVVDFVVFLAYLQATSQDFESARITSSLFPIFWEFQVFYLAKFVFLLAVLLAVVALFVKHRDPKPVYPGFVNSGVPLVPGSAPTTSEVPAQNFAAPGPTGVTGATGIGAPSQLPIFALIGAFVVPLAGIIMGHIALSQMNKGQISSQNRTMAIAGLALGYVFMAFGLVASIILVIVVISNPYLFGGY